MSIYRGAGGAGDAVNDAASEVLLTIQARDAALAAQAAAEAAQVAAELAETNAETAETNAETAETNAETAETNAETAATNAASSASAASTSASNASASASAASTSASNASSSASSASTSATNAANSASTATTQATNASNSASAASTSATNASNSASAASTSATNAASSATAAAGSATNAASSATSASGSASTATTQATNASNSASAASTSATNASNSASAASTSATNASNSASAAATSATNASNSASAASTSASNAATSESNAATSATNAAASYDSFDDRYLGAKSSAPTLDNDGNALLTGALYFNTVDNAMKVYNGSAWLDAYASLSGALIATNNLADLTNTGTARTNLGVAIGTNVQAWDADLDTWATKTAPTGTVVGTSDSQTLTNKTIALGSNTVSGTLAQFNTAVTDADLVSIAGTETLTNKTLTSPTINTATISGGTINNATIGATTPSTGSFTSLTDSGNLTFTGTGNRITGDFSNGTLVNRVAFQSSTTNGNTFVSIIPNGTGVQAGIVIDSDSAQTNGAVLSYSLTTADARINSTIRGTGTYLPLTMHTGGSERLRIDTSGNVGIGTSSPDSSNKLQVAGDIGLSWAANKFIGMKFDSGSSYKMGLMLNDTTRECKVWSQSSDSDDKITFYTGATPSERMRIDSSGNVGIGTSSPSVKLEVSGRVLGDSLVAANAVYIWSQNRMSLGASYGIESQQNSPLFMLTQGVAQPIVFGTNSTERMRIDSSGNVGIGTSSPACRLDLNRGSAGLLANFTDGVNTNFQIETASLLATIGPSAGSTGMAFKTGNTERMRINSSGQVLVGATSLANNEKVSIVTGDTTGMVIKSAGGATYAPIYAWNATTTGDGYFAAFFTETSASFRGSITYNRGAGLVAYNTTSDYRAKDIISPVLNSGEVIDSVPVYMGKMKGATQARPMFVAHETPDYAHTGEKDAVDKDGNPVYQQMDASSLVPVLWAEIQSLRKRVAQLESK